MNIIVFFGYGVTLHGIEMDEVNVKVIYEWPTPKYMIKVRSFHGLASFYRCFVKVFSTITNSSNEVVKEFVGFKWDKE